SSTFSLLKRSLTFTTDSFPFLELEAIGSIAFKFWQVLDLLRRHLSFRDDDLRFGVRLCQESLCLFDDEIKVREDDRTVEPIKLQLVDSHLRRVSLYQGLTSGDDVLDVRLHRIQFTRLKGLLEVSLDLHEGLAIDRVQ